MNRRKLLFGEIEDADVAEVSVVLRIVEAVTDNKFVGDSKSNVVGMDSLDAALGLIEKRRDAQSLWAALLKDALKIVQRKAGIENIFDQNYVQARDAGVQVLGEPNLAG